MYNEMATSSRAEFAGRIRPMDMGQPSIASFSAYQKQDAR